MVNIKNLERDVLRQAELCLRNTIRKNINNTLISTAVTDAASEVLGKVRRRKKP